LSGVIFHFVLSCFNKHGLARVPHATLLHDALRCYGVYALRAAAAAAASLAIGHLALSLVALRSCALK
jgi:hypothetical protein